MSLFEPYDDSKLQQNIKIAIKYATNIIGTKYQYWSYNLENIFNEPMWASNDFPPLESEVITKTINCSGLANLMRRSVGLTVPGLDEKMEHPGGTGAWFQYLNERNVLYSFDYTLFFPIGTLFLRKYQSETDQGHISILYDLNSKGSLFSTIIHSCSYSEFIEKEILNPGVTIKYNLGESYFFIQSGYYQYYCLPENWLI